MIEVLGRNIFSPLGADLEQNYRAVRAGKSALRLRGDDSGWRGIPDRPVASLLEDGFVLEGFSRFESMVISSVSDALSSSGVDPESPKCIFILSTTKADVESLEQVVYRGEGTQLTLLERGEDTLRLQVRCSKGTYIRTLCKDIGEALGCGGCMQQLRRTSAGEYTIEEAVPLEALLESENPEQFLRPVDSIFRSYPRVKLTANQEKRCRNGNPFSLSVPEGTYRAYSESGEFLMLGKVESGIMSTIKSFFEP